MIGMVDGSGSIFSAIFQLIVTATLKYMFLYYAGCSLAICVLLWPMAKMEFQAYRSRTSHPEGPDGLTSYGNYVEFTDNNGNRAMKRMATEKLDVEDEQSDVLFR